MELVLALALWLFAVTHVDTLIVLVAFCADDRYGFPEVLVGHYLGFGLGLLVAVVAAVLAPEAFRESAFLLGVVPLGMGVWGIVRGASDVASPDTESTGGWLDRIFVVGAAGVGLSGENVVVFVPFFVTLTAFEFAVVIATYVVAAAVPLLLALLLAKRARRIGLPTWVEAWLVPIALVVVGGYVLVVGWIGV